MQSTLPEDNVTAATAVIRTGSDGRLRFDPRHREALLEAFQASGQTAMAFARQHGVKYQTFIAWQRKRREAAAPEVSPRPAFAEVRLDEGRPSAPPALRILLPGGAVIEIPSRASLPLALELLTNLRPPC